MADATGLSAAEVERLSAAARRENALAQRAVAARILRGLWVAPGSVFQPPVFADVQELAHLVQTLLHATRALREPPPEGYAYFALEQVVEALNVLNERALDPRRTPAERQALLDAQVDRVRFLAQACLIATAGVV